MAMTRDEQRAMEILREAVSEVASLHEYPMAPALYVEIQRTWRRIVINSRNALKKTEDVT
jgi:hypothetical protein